MCKRLNCDALNRLVVGLRLAQTRVLHLRVDEIVCASSFGRNVLKDLGKLTSEKSSTYVKCLDVQPPKDVISSQISEGQGLPRKNHVLTHTYVMTHVTRIRGFCSCSGRKNRLRESHTPPHP